MVNESNIIPKEGKGSLLNVLTHNLVKVIENLGPVLKAGTKIMNKHVNPVHMELWFWCVHSGGWN